LDVGGSMFSLGLGRGRRDLEMVATIVCLGRGVGRRVKGFISQCYFIG